MTVRVPRHLTERDPAILAPRAGLVCFVDDQPGLTRRRRGRGFSYHGPDGTLVSGAQRNRIEALAIPPAWAQVWICPVDDGYLQASGYDDAGRKQYRYHDDYRAFRDDQKFRRLVHVPRALRILRVAIAEGLGRPLGEREHAVAAALQIIDLLLLRVGNENSAADGSYGATTLAADHLSSDPGALAEVTDADRTRVAGPAGSTEGEAMVLEYRSKGGQERIVRVDDDEMIEVLQRLADPDHERLFWYHDGDEVRHVNAATVNTAIAELVGPAFTAKDFRTWGASREAMEARVDGADPIAAADQAAAALGNTRAVARASYIHPRVLDDDPSPMLSCWKRSRSSTVLSRGDSALAKLLAE